MQLLTVLRTFSDYRDALEFILRTASHVEDPQEAVAYAAEAMRALDAERDRLAAGSTDVELAFWVGHEFFTLIPLREAAAHDESLGEWRELCAGALRSTALLRAVRAAAVDRGALEHKIRQTRADTI